MSTVNNYSCTNEAKQKPKPITNSYETGCPYFQTPRGAMFGANVDTFYLIILLKNLCQETVLNVLLVQANAKKKILLRLLHVFSRFVSDTFGTFVFYVCLFIVFFFKS